MTLVNTGYEISNCLDCGTNIHYRVDEQWTYNEETKAGINIAFTNKAPKYCPICASENIELTDEQVNQWEFAARAAELPTNPETLELIEELYKTAWNAALEESFIQFLKDSLK